MLALLALLSPAAWGAPPGLRRPERLTAGPSDQFLGAVGPGGLLYFVDNAGGTTQIFVQSPGRGAAEPLFDERRDTDAAADATWPRPSPDGKRVLYISRQTAAAGQLCLREIDDKGRIGKRRCLTGEGGAEVQAFWFPDGKSIGAVGRASLHGDLQLRRYPVGAAGRGEVLLARSLSSPAISPDGRWLAYVPLERELPDVGPSFVADAGKTLALQRMDRLGAAPAALDFGLPGTCGFPAFSADGKWLYFTQYLNDTNFDGLIDGNDHGVLFRAPFGGGDRPVDGARAEQLTSAGWNCQYPSPSGGDRLIATCLFEGALHVYALPLDGALPADWSAARINDELSATRDRWLKLLLLGRRLELEPEAARAPTLLAMIHLHLDLGEYASADFYAHRLRSRVLDGVADMAAPLHELVEHRRAERLLSRGQLSERFIADARARLKRLATRSPAPATAALTALVRSEIHDVLGEEDEAAAELRALDPAKLDQPFVLHLVGERVAEHHHELGDRAPILDIYRALAAHPAWGERERLDYADAFVRELLRGRPVAEWPALIDRWLPKAARGPSAGSGRGTPGPVDPDGELGFRLELERRLVGLAPETQEEVRARVFDLYRRNKGFERRRALAGTTMRRAARADNDFLLYQFANTWVSYVDQQRAVRRAAEADYRDVVLERAYIQSGRGETGDARGNFWGVTLQTDALEAHIGFVEERLREGKDPITDYEQRYGAAPDDPILAFARAYLAARALPSLGEEAAHAAGAARAAELLGGVARKLPQRREVHHLLGYVHHQRWLRAGDRRAAREAASQYLLALDLSREHPRARAALLEALGLVQASVGNHAIAVGHFTARDRLPFFGAGAELAHRVYKARSLFHIGRDGEAAREAAAGLALVEANPALQKFRPLVLDRAALYHLAAGDAARARALYHALVPLVEGAAEPERARNRFTARVGRAAAALASGDAAAALTDVAEAERLLSAGPVPALVGREAETAAAADGRRDHELLLAGLRAEAHARSGDYAAAGTAMARRRDLLAARQKERDADDDLLDLAVAEAHLGRYAHGRRDEAAAVRHLEAALAHTDAFGERTGSPLHDTGLAVIAALAELHVAGVPLRAFRVDLRQRLQGAFDALLRRRHPPWAPMRARLGVYLTLLRLDGGRPRARLPGAAPAPAVTMSGYAADERP